MSIEIVSFSVELWPDGVTVAGGVEITCSTPTRVEVAVWAATAANQEHPLASEKRRVRVRGHDLVQIPIRLPDRKETRWEWPSIVWNAGVIVGGEWIATAYSQAE